MKILIKNANLISMSNKMDKILFNIDILIKDNKIIKIEKDITEKVDKEIETTRKSSNARFN